MSNEDEDVVPEWLQDKRQERPEPLLQRHKTSRNERTADKTSASPLLRDVAFNRHSMNDGHHVSPYDNRTVQIGADGIVVKLVQGIDVPALQRTLSMATRATIGVDLDEPLPGDWESCKELLRYWTGANYDSCLRPQLGWPELGCGHNSHQVRAGSLGAAERYQGQVPGGDWEEMLKGGLQTALETCVVVFAVQGVSRTCTHQLVRSRRAAFHQQSQRASYMGDYPEARMPESVWRDEEARNAFLDAAMAAQTAYQVACERDISYQDARYILPEATTNYIMCEYTLREFMNVFAYRGCSMFSWEIVYVMRRMRELLVEEYPWLEPHIKISCEKTSGAKDRRELQRIETPGEADHTCTFQGWESVEGQCDFPWARESNRQFRSDAHRIERAQIPLTPVGGQAGKTMPPVKRETPINDLDRFHLVLSDADIAASNPYDERVGPCPAALENVVHMAHKWHENDVPGTAWCEGVQRVPERCPACDSRDPHAHPSISGGGEVTRICDDNWHRAQ